MGKWGWVFLVTLGLSAGASRAPRSESNLLGALLSKTPAQVAYQGKTVFWNTQKKDGQWCRSSDTLGDGKPHVTDCFAAKRFISHARDWDGDGKTDEYTTFKPDGSIVRRFDSHFKGKANLRVTIIREGKYIVRTSERNFGTKKPDWKVVSIGRYPAIQEDDPADSEDVKSEYSKAMEGVQGLSDIANPFDKLAEADANYQPTDFGFQIEKACFDSQPKIDEMFRRSLIEGTQCLWDHGGEGKVHVAAIGALLLKDPHPRLMCMFNEPWGTRNAVSSLSSNDAFIVLNPKFLQSATEQSFKQTLLHELFHPAWGLAHGVHVDYAYACSSCCFPGEAKNDNDKKMQASNTKLACDICSSHFVDGTDDLKYLDKLSEFLPGIHRSAFAVRPILQYLKKNQHESNGRTAKLLLIKVLSGISESPLGSALAKSFGASRTNSEKTILDAARRYDSKSWASLYAPASAQVVTAIQHWLKGDDEATAELIKKSQYPTSGVDPKVKIVIEKAMDRARLVLAEMVYDSFRSQGMKKRMEDFQREVLQGLEKRINEQ